MFASDSVPSDTSTEVDDDLWSVLDALTSLHVPVKSSFETYRDAGDAQESIFLVPVRRKGKKPILFGRITSEPMSREKSESEEESPQFGHYEPKALRMMRGMGYDLASGPGLNSAKEGGRYFNPSFRKGRPLIIIIRLAGGWAMYQLRLHQPLILEGHQAIKTLQAGHRGSQMSVSATSSENFQ